MLKRCVVHKRFYTERVACPGCRQAVERHEVREAARAETVGPWEARELLIAARARYYEVARADVAGDYGDEAAEEYGLEVELGQHDWSLPEPIVRMARRYGLFGRDLYFSRS